MRTQTTMNRTVNINRNWEIAAWISALILFAIMLVSSVAQAGIPQNMEEAYVDDIPFDTEWIAHQATLPSIDFEDESYVDDIPFNTEQIAANATYKKAVETEFMFEEESYVDDVPFNTEYIAQQANFRDAFAKEYNMAEEAYVDDIPFDTCKIAANASKNAMLIDYACKD